VVSSDGRQSLLGDFVNGDIDVLRLDGDKLTKVAKLVLARHPASIRERPPYDSVFWRGIDLNKIVGIRKGRVLLIRRLS
jgi:hypothetical protein